MDYHKLGKRPASPTKPTDLLFAKYRLTQNLPPILERFGFTRLKARPWGMLSNDSVGDCVIAWAMHCCMLQGELVGKTINFTPANAIQIYSEATGYNPADPSTDQGTNMADFMDFWKNAGLVDDQGNRHKLAAWARVNIADPQEVLEALFIFKAVSFGIQFPASAMDQFNQNEPWDVVLGATIEGGHCVGAVSRYDMLNVVTWGQPQGVTAAFLSAYLDEGYIPISEDMMNGEGLDTNGFDLAQLQADAAQLG